jgi:thioester reductase-like protein
MPAITLTVTADAAMTVILTGSTGSLGSYLLDSLVHQQDVRKIYCLNRAEDGGRSKQKTESGDRGLDTAGWGERVEFLHVDLSQPKFGLSSQKYVQLLQETTHIIREFSPSILQTISETDHPIQTINGP